MAAHTCRDVRGFIAARPELFPKRKTETPEAYLGTQTVHVYMDNVSAYIRMVRCGLAAGKRGVLLPRERHADGAA